MQRAQDLARSPYREPDRRLPEAVRNLGYDQYLDIRFRADRALWRGDRLPFEVMFFHPGSSFTEPVKIHEVTPAGVVEVPFDPAAFDYGHNRVDPESLRGLGFAGWRRTPGPASSRPRRAPPGG